MNALELAEKLVDDRDRVDRAIVQNCPIPVFNTGKDGKWLAVNRPFATLLAVEADDLLANRWQKVLFPDEAKRIKREWESLLDSGIDTGRIHFKFRAGDGRTVSGYASMIRLEDGKWLGFLVPICDTPQNCPVHMFLLHNLEPASK